MKIHIAKEAEVPGGPVCENWAYRTNMPADQNFRCDHLRRDCQTFTDRDMGGFSDRMNYMYSSRCALFDAQLMEEAGVGPKKCMACISAGTVDEG